MMDGRTDDRRPSGLEVIDAVAAREGSGPSEDRAAIALTATTLPYAAGALVRRLLDGVHVPSRAHTPRRLWPYQRAGWAHRVRLAGDGGTEVEITWDDGATEWRPAAEVCAAIVAGS